MQTETQTISFRIPTRQLECIKQTARQIAAAENREYSYTDLIRDSIEQFTFGLLSEEETSTKKFAFIHISKSMIESWIDFKDGLVVERFFDGDTDSVNVLLSGDALWEIGNNGSPPMIGISQVSKKFVGENTFKRRSLK